MKIVTFFLFLKFLLISSDLVRRNDNFLEFVRNSGYKSEAYEVETEDGYLLTLHRILPKVENSELKRNPVFLMHGIVATSGDYVVTGKEKALAFLLADSGFDVWLGNARGNKYSTNHRNISTESKKFWNFSWHEIGYYDLPAMIDYMLYITRTSRAFFVGHSQGTTAFTVMLSTRPEYNEKIIQAHLLSPVIFMEKFPHAIAKYLKPAVEKGLLDTYTYMSFQDVWDLMMQVRGHYCKEKKLSGIYCPALVFPILYIFGFNKDGLEMDTNVLKILETHLSPRISINQLKHFTQHIYTKNFQEFKLKDENCSNSSSAVSYPLYNIKAPVYLYHATEDSLLSNFDFLRLKEYLPNVKQQRMIPNWNHCDFNYGKNARKVLYYDILKTLESIYE